MLDENNALFRDNSQMLQELLFVNSDEQIAANNLVYAGYTETYNMMINYVYEE